MTDVTRILSAIDQGDPHAAEWRPARRRRGKLPCRIVLGKSSASFPLSGPLPGRSVPAGRQPVSTGGSAGVGGASGVGAGGAIYDAGANLTVANSTFGFGAGNTASGGFNLFGAALGGNGMGGAIFIVGGNASVANSVFDGNSANGGGSGPGGGDGLGGGIYLASLSLGLKPMFEEEARPRQVAGLRQGADFPVGENSPQRGNVAENDKVAQKAAEPMRVADFQRQGN